MKYVHNFDTTSAFTESYNGAEYEEPWVSYVKETEAVNYNKEKKWLRIFEEGYGSSYTLEEEEVLNNIFNYWYIAPEVVSEEVEAEIREDIEIYYVYSLTDDFDREDPNTYMYKMTPTTVSYVSGSSSYFYISDGECLKGDFTAPDTSYARYGTVGCGSIWDICG